MVSRKLWSCLLVLLLVISAPLSVGSQAKAQEKKTLTIRILQGNNHVITKDGELVFHVEVREGDTVVPGAEVTFVAPESGPGILFAGNMTTMTVRTDDRGRAASGPTRSIGGQGPFAVGITAMALNRSGATTAQAINQMPDPNSPVVKKKNNKLMWILIGAGGAAAGAAFAAKGKPGSVGGPGTPGTSTPTAPGSQDLGTPQGNVSF